jgi:hypothetical protein
MPPKWTERGDRGSVASESKSGPKLSFLKKKEAGIQRDSKFGGNHVHHGWFLPHPFQESRRSRAMTRSVLLKAAFFVGAVAAPIAVVGAQAWTPGSEIAGQTVQVQTNGVMNSITFNADGTATIATPDGTTVPGTWSAANNMLCLSANGAQECWPYSQPFQAGQQLALTSSCNQVTTFMPSSTNPPVQRSGGERG